MGKKRSERGEATKHDMELPPPPPERGVGGRVLGPPSRLAPAQLAGALVVAVLVAGIAASAAAETSAAGTGAETQAGSAVDQPVKPAGPVTEDQVSRPLQLAEAVPIGGNFPIFRTLGGLGLVLSFILGGFVVAKRFAPQYFKASPRDRILRVVETLPMGDKRSLAVVQVGDRRYLVGNTTQQISILTNLGEVLDDREEFEPPSESRDPLPGKMRGGLSSFRGLYEKEKSGRAAVRQVRPIPAELRAKMRRLRDSLEA